MKYVILLIITLYGLLLFDLFPQVAKNLNRASYIDWIIGMGGDNIFQKFIILILNYHILPSQLGMPLLYTLEIATNNTYLFEFLGQTYKQDNVIIALIFNAFKITFMSVIPQSP